MKSSDYWWAGFSYGVPAGMVLCMILYLLVKLIP